MIKALSKDTVSHRIISWASWPLLMSVCILITVYGFTVDAPLLYFNVAYAFLIISLLILERFIPHNTEWHKNDGQTWQSIGHTLSSKGVVQGLVAFGGVIGIAELIKPMADPINYGIWPRDWPMWIQVIMGVYIAEFMLYWVHRLGHEVPFFWRFHAVHHSVNRLWVINTGRFHFIDSLLSIIFGMGLLLLLGAPLEIIMWLASITAFIGVLTHCNVNMKFGFLSLIFNTPELHRWHHSRELREGNRNYCENVMIWDHVFGTFVNPKRPPPSDIGMGDFMPDKFWHQLLWPLLPASIKKKIMPEFEALPFGYEDAVTRPRLFGGPKKPNKADA